ncbi:MAG: hypothetical protein VKK04_13235 [Synechococcales bacterium]|nr:hypothetical protein [Synechococcales bacterium]
MVPKFSDTRTWQQAELLMQPAFIRVIDNIRKHLDQSPWRGTYRDVHVWPRGTTPEAKIRVMQLQRELETANSEEAADIQNALDHLPRPYPGYELCLHHHDREVTVDLWQLCFEICFSNYCSDLPGSHHLSGANLSDQADQDPPHAAAAHAVEFHTDSASASANSPAFAPEFVEVDISLIDPETGDVDWHRLDAKAKAIIDGVFASLPVAPGGE